MIHVGSILGKYPFPYVSTYSATKAFNDKYFESISNEDSDTHIMNITPFYVCTKMINYQKSMLTISPEEFVTSAVKHYNYGRKTACGHYKHEITDMLLNVEYFRKYNYKILEDIANKLERISKLRRK